VPDVAEQVARFRDRHEPPNAGLHM
jgi:hypothetical protein